MADPTPATVGIPIRDVDGWEGRLSPKQAAARIAEGATQLSEDEVQQIKLQQDYGGTGGQIAAGAAGAARGATMGLSDLAVAGIGGKDAADKLAKLKKANPITSTVGEVGGALAPILLSGGAAAPEVAAAEGAGEVGTLARVGRAIGAPVRAVDAAGQIAEHAAATVFGNAAEGTLARAAQKGLQGVARGAVEGALFGAGNEISETSLGDHNLTGESLMAAIGHGALFGGLAGGTMGAGGSLVGSAAKGIAAKLSPALREVAEGQAWKAVATGGNMSKVTREADKIQGGLKGVQRWLLDNGLVQAGDDVAAIAPRLEARKLAAGAAIEESLTTAEAAGAKFDARKVAARIKSDVMNELDKSPNLNRAAIAKMDDLAKDYVLQVETEGTVKAMHTFRRQVDDVIGPKWSPNALDNPTSEALKKTRSILEDEIESAGDSVADKAGMGKAWRDTYKANKLEWQRANIADKAAQESLIAAGKNRSISLTDTIAGAGGLAAGAATGHPLAMLGGLVASAGNKLVRERGSATAASVLDKIADLAAVRKIAGKVEGQTSKAMDAFVAGDRKALPYRSAPIKDYEVAAKEVKAAAASPQGTATAMGRHLQTIAQSAPKVADAFRMSAVRASTYLSTKLPKDGGVGTTLQPQFQRHEPSDQAKADFLKAYGAVDDPVSVIHDMAAGKLTHTQVEAIRTVYPALFAKMQQSAASAVASKKSKLDYNQTIQLGILLGVPTDPSLKPATVQLLQSSYTGSSSNPQGPPKTPTAPKRMLKGFGDAGELQTRGKL